jgi:hypothetical protein
MLAILSQCFKLVVLHEVERCDVCVVFVSWLIAIGIVPLRVVLGALGSLRLLSIFTIHSVYSTFFRLLAPAFHPYNSFCLLSAPLSIVTVVLHERCSNVMCWKMLNRQGPEKGAKGASFHSMHQNCCY